MVAVTGTKSKRAALRKSRQVGGTCFVISGLFRPDLEFDLAYDRLADHPGPAVDSAVPGSVLACDRPVDHPGPAAGFAGQACQLRSRLAAACFDLSF
jgi:hypothetical protein